MIKPLHLLAVNVRTIRWIRRAVLSCTGRRKEHSYKVCDSRKKEADRSHAVTFGRASFAPRAAPKWTSDPKLERGALVTSRRRTGQIVWRKPSDRARSCQRRKGSVQDFSHSASSTSRAKGGLATRTRAALAVAETARLAPYRAPRCGVGRCSLKRDQPAPIEVDLPDP